MAQASLKSPKGGSGDKAKAKAATSGPGPLHGVHRKWAERGWIVKRCGPALRDSHWLSPTWNFAFPRKTPPPTQHPTTLSPTQPGTCTWPGEPRRSTAPWVHSHALAHPFRKCPTIAEGQEVPCVQRGSDIKKLSEPECPVRSAIHSFRAALQLGLEVASVYTDV
jgi:hypothetical protein